MHDRAQTVRCASVVSALVAGLWVAGCANKPIAYPVPPLRQMVPATSPGTVLPPLAGQKSAGDVAGASAAVTHAALPSMSATVIAQPMMEEPSASDIKPAEEATASHPMTAATSAALSLPQITTAWTETGIASWYGPGFHGKRTASGERFDTRALTAAHKTLPFGTRVRVKSLVSGKEVVVRINDRGPFVVGRVIDLSKAAAQMLGLAGVKPVLLELLP